MLAKTAVGSLAVDSRGRRLVNPSVIVLVARNSDSHDVAAAVKLLQPGSVV
jgi:hypothetical protein